MNILHQVPEEIYNLENLLDINKSMKSVGQFYIFRILFLYRFNKKTMHCVNYDN